MAAVCERCEESDGTHRTGAVLEGKARGMEQSTARSRGDFDEETRETGQSEEKFDENVTGHRRCGRDATMRIRERSIDGRMRQRTLMMRGLMNEWR